MGSVMWCWGSIWRGLRAMRRDRAPGAGWRVKWERCGWWAHCWTPVWHKGRGPYLTVGLGIVSIMRGY